MQLAAFKRSKRNGCYLVGDNYCVVSELVFCKGFLPDCGEVCRQIGVLKVSATSESTSAYGCQRGGIANIQQGVAAEESLFAYLRNSFFKYYFCQFVAKTERKIPDLCNFILAVFSSIGERSGNDKLSHRVLTDSCILTISNFCDAFSCDVKPNWNICSIQFGCTFYERFFL